MNLLTGKLYDPAAAVSKSCAALLALTAFDTTNLRLSFTAPASGMVLVRMRTCLSGATTMPQVLLGVLEGATVKGRQAPQATLSGTAVATTIVHLHSEFLVTGLTPGASLNWDAAYGVETIVAATNIRYGGPNNTTANDAWGGFAFEVWDPQPQTTTGQLQVDSSGRVDVSKVAGTAQTARDLGAQLDVAVSTRLAPTTAGRTLDVSATGEAGVDWANVGSPTTAVNLSGTTIATTQAIASVSGAVGSVTGAVGSVTGAVGSVTGNVGGNVVGSVGSVTAAVTLTAAYDAAKTAASSADYTALRAGKLDNLDALISSRLSSAGYTAPDNSSIGSILSLTSAALDATISSRLATIAYAAPPSAATISAQVLSDAQTTPIHADVRKVTGTAISGTGTELDPWGP